MACRVFCGVFLVLLCASAGCRRSAVSSALVPAPPVTADSPPAGGIHPLPEVAEAHPAPDNTPGMDKAETEQAARPDDPAANLRLAFAYYKVKAYAQAAPAFVKAASLNPGKPAPLLYLGYTQMAVGALDGAIATFTQTAALQTASRVEKGEAFLQIGNCWWALREDQKAADAFQKALQADPKQGRASLALGTWAAQNRKPDTAKKYFTDAVRDLTGNRARAQAYACLGRLAEDRKNASDAQTNYQKAVSLDKENAWAAQALVRLKK